jgi:hypothetical protein
MSARHRRHVRTRFRPLPVFAAVTALVIAGLMAASAPGGAATTGAIALGTRILPGQSVPSANGSHQLVMQTDGNLVVYSSDGRALWTSGTAGRGAAFVAGADGNLAVVNRTGRPVWTSATGGKHAGRLLVQNDGNVVLYRNSGGVLWATRSIDPFPAPIPGSTTPAMIRAGRTLISGGSLVSPNGRYSAVLQPDGNFVISGPGRVLWASNSMGWNGDSLALQADGNLVLYTNFGLPLFQTRTHGRSGAVLTIQNDGNLVLYTLSARPLWSTFTSPRPTDIFPPVTSPPPTSTSRYVRNLTGTGTDGTVMSNEGCTDAHNNPSGRRYYILLDFGAQANNVSGHWGVQLTVTTIRVTDSAVVAAANAYLDGYAQCMAPYSQVLLAIGTNNDGEPAVLGAAGGAVWAREVIRPIAAHAAAKGRFTVAAANDMEPGFAGTMGQASSWLGGYLAASPAPFSFFGSADGCPYQALGQRGGCNFGWTQHGLYALAFGAAPGRMVPMPEIYFPELAVQWANISLVGRLIDGRPITFGGALTEVTACAQDHGRCGSMASHSAWNALWTDLRTDPRTTQRELRYVTDLRIDAR